jgi:hypothetical protein
MDSIKLNDLLRLENLNNVKIRFNLMFAQNWNPIELFKNGDISTMLAGQYWNYNKNVKIKPNEDFWLLFHIGQVTNDLNLLNGVGYDYQDLPEYQKYIGRLIVKFKNKAQTMIRNAKSVIDDCYVSQILPDTFDNDLFPGYEKVNISWDEMNRVLEKDNWKTALQNQKGVYLMTDISNGKMYVSWTLESLCKKWKRWKCWT